MSKVNLRRFSDGITQRIADEDQVELGCTVKLWFVLQTPFSLNNFCLILVNFGYRDFIYDKIDLSVIRAGYCTRIARI